MPPDDIQGQRNSDELPEQSPPRRRRKWHQWLLTLLGSVVLVLILTQLDLHSLLAILANVDVALFFAACTSLLLTVFLRTWRWRMLLIDQVGSSPRYWDLVIIYAYSTFIGVATPGRVGEFVKGVHLARRGIPSGAAMANVLTDRMMDVVTLLAIALASFIFVVVPGIQGRILVVGLVLGVLGSIIATWLAIRSPLLDRLTGKLGELEFEPMRRFFDWCAGVTRDFRDAIRSQSFGALLIAMIPTLLAWGIVYGANQLMAVSMGLELGYLDVVAISAITSLVAQLPVSVLGIGTRDAAMILILAKYGVSEESAVVLSTLFLASIIFVALACSLSLLSPTARGLSNDSDESLR